jgi:hypothetical protein
MKMEINFSKFCDAFHHMGRGEQFSYDAKRGLFDYLEEIDEDYDLDVIALCCEYTESSYDGVREMSSLGDEEETSDEGVIEYLNRHTSVVWHDSDSVLYAEF